MGLLGLGIARDRKPLRRVGKWQNFVNETKPVSEANDPRQSHWRFLKINEPDVLAKPVNAFRVY